MSNLISLAEAAKQIGVKPQTLRLYRKNGKVIGYKEKNRIYFTANELNVAFNLKLPAEHDWYIGLEFDTLARMNNQRINYGYYSFRREYKPFDGSIYLPDRFLITEDPLFEFVCARMYHYNNAVQRYHPNKPLCHLVIAMSSKPEKAQIFKEQMDRLYPGIVLLSTESRIYRIKSKYYEQAKRKKYYQGHAHQKRKRKTNK